MPARWKPKTSICHSSRRIAPSATWREFEMRDDELDVAPQRLRVGVAGLAPARGQRVAEPVMDEAELGPQRLPLAVRPAQDRGAGEVQSVLLERCVELLGDRDPQRGVREHPGEVVDPRAKQAERRPPMQLQRAGERVGPDLGVPVHVAAGPAAVGEHGLHEPDAERVLDLAQHGGHGVEQDGLEEEQVAADLVLHASAGSRRSSSVCHHSVRTSRSSSSSARRRE